MMFAFIFLSLAIDRVTLFTLISNFCWKYVCKEYSHSNNKQRVFMSHNYVLWRLPELSESHTRRHRWKFNQIDLIFFVNIPTFCIETKTIQRLLKKTLFGEFLIIIPINNVKTLHPYNKHLTFKVNMKVYNSISWYSVF